MGKRPNSLVMISVILKEIRREEYKGAVLSPYGARYSGKQTSAGITFIDTVFELDALEPQRILPGIK